MSVKITAILGVLLLGLVGFVFFYERPRMAQEQEALEAQQAFIEVARHSVARFTLTNTHGRFVGEKRGNEWVLVEPIEVPADWFEFEGLIESSQLVERGRLIIGEDEFADTDLSIFGLAPPQIEVKFEPEQGEVIRLLFGDDIPSGQGCYLTWSSGNKVVLAKKATRARFNRPLFELRDRRMFPIDLDLVTRAHFKRPDQSFDVVKEGLQWHLKSPITGRANQTDVLKLLGRLKDERVVGFHSETVDDPVRYGFDDPEYKVVLHRQDGEEPWTLLLGKEVPDDRQGLWYGRVADRPQVFLMEPFIIESLSVPLNALRYKQVFEFEQAGIDRVQLAYPESVIECAKDDGAWTITLPAGSVVDDGELIENLVDRVHNLIATEFTDPAAKSDYGMDKPVLIVSLWQGQKLIQELTIGHANNRWYGKGLASDEVVALPYQVMSWLQLDVVPVKSKEGA